jgi:hypothetical protein
MPRGVASLTACHELLRGSSNTLFRWLFGFRSPFIGMPLNELVSRVSPTRKDLRQRQQALVPNEDEVTATLARSGLSRFRFYNHTSLAACIRRGPLS